MKQVFDVRRSNDGDDVLKCVNGVFRKVEILTGDKTLEDTDSGTLYCFNSSSAIAVTLPSSASKHQLVMDVMVEELCPLFMLILVIIN